MIVNYSSLQKENRDRENQAARAMLDKNIYTYVPLTYLEIEIINKIRRAGEKERCKIFDILKAPYTPGMELFRYMEREKIKDENKKKKEAEKHRKQQAAAVKWFEEYYETQQRSFGERQINRK